MSTHERQQSQKMCIICDHFVSPQEVSSCPWCRLEEVCTFCFFPVWGEKSGLKRCFACSIPFCEECGWHAASAMNPKNERELLKWDRGYKFDYRCPNPACHSALIWADPYGGRSPLSYLRKQEARLHKDTSASWEVGEERQHDLPDSLRTQLNDIDFSL